MSPRVSLGVSMCVGTLCDSVCAFSCMNVGTVLAHLVARLCLRGVDGPGSCPWPVCVQGNGRLWLMYVGLGLGLLPLPHSQPSHTFLVYGRDTALLSQGSVCCGERRETSRVRLDSGGGKDRPPGPHTRRHLATVCGACVDPCMLSPLWKQLKTPTSSFSCSPDPTGCHREGFI